MAGTSVKVDSSVYDNVVKHTQNNGSKIGKFFELAAKEKIDRETKPVAEWPIKKETK